MKLSNSVKEIIGDKKSRDARNFRMDLAKALHFTEYWMGKVIEANKDNGPLTLEKSLQMIEAFTALDRAQILVDGKESEEVTHAQKVA